MVSLFAILLIEVADKITEENLNPEKGSALYNFLYPDKELLPEDKEMSIFDHLEELRERLFVSVLAVGAAIMGCFVYSKELIMLLEAPVRTQGVRFLQLAPGEFFFTTIKVSGYCGILLGSPVILYEIIAFILPGLTKSERRFLAPIVLGSSILFYTGIAFSYSVLTPAALNFFVTYAEGVVESLWSIDQYFEFVLVLMFSTGLSFQMLSIWRYVVVGAVVAAAIVTPSTDPLTQLLLAGPLLGLYFGGAWTVKLIGRFKLLHEILKFLPTLFFKDSSYTHQEYRLEREVLLPAHARRRGDSMSTGSSSGESDESCGELDETGESSGESDESWGDGGDGRQNGRFVTRSS
ncbi:Sec-independent periplasmic protein translocase TatC [Cynara cardunculus var. scolymus]|uniref:Sec-independent periplasmic protein translocase TatC n=1 Tax=Cynara cardunculus var. scolymus TaxID=59895 RepID=A0A103XVF2_CYNCS|nr:Sec-independent periplasmic protein translocase TatC [Cynara cardunculus var. scolymus]